MNPSFFQFAILDERFKYHLWLSSPSGAGRNKTLSIDSMLGFVFQVPSVLEQQMIGAFFRDLDDLITLHQRKQKGRVTARNVAVYLSLSCG